MNSTSTSNNDIINSKRYHDESWDFRTVDTKPLTHGFHTYPAMMIPQIAARLIDMYGENAEVLLDPFMGSGTSLVEAKVHAQFKEAYGIDINPLARLIGKVKSTPLNIKKVRSVSRDLIQSIRDTIFAVNSGLQQVEVFSFNHIEFWFKPKVIRDLTIIKQKINEIEDVDIRDFFLVAYSEIVRYVSNTRNSEFKLYRMSPKSLEKHNPDTLSEFEKRVNYNISQLEIFSKEAKSCKIHVLNEDTREKTSIKSNSVDLIVTSPPYGDSKTTVAYGQFSRLSLEFLGYDSPEVRKIDSVSLGGVKAKDFTLDLDSPTLRNELAAISEVDEKRALEVISFYQDFAKCVREIDRVMKIGGYVCLVVGNRTVKKIKLSTDIIIVEQFLALGKYEHEQTIIRNIPSKRMPKANSPTNVKGETLSTMNEEYIIILKKVN